MLELEIFMLIIFDVSLLLYLLSAQSVGPLAPQHFNCNQIHLQIFSDSKKIHKKLPVVEMCQMHLSSLGTRHIHFVRYSSQLLGTYHQERFCYELPRHQLQFQRPKRATGSRRTIRIHFFTALVFKTLHLSLTVISIQ